MLRSWCKRPLCRRAGGLHIGFVNHRLRRDVPSVLATRGWPERFLVLLKPN